MSTIVIGKMGEQRRAKHAEWGHLRVAGRPLISSVTVGDTPLLWVACRASPCLVHVYEDSHLKMIWRFTSDPIFMSFEKESNSFVKKGFQPLASQNQNLPSLLVVTDDGSVWHLPACLIDERIERPSKRRKEKVNNEGDGGYEENEWGGLFDDLDPYDHMECDNTVSAKVSSSSRMITAGGSCSKHRAVKTSSLNREGMLLHAKKMVHSFPSRSFCKITSTLVMEKNLVGIVPNATFASIGPENIVLVFSSFGLQIFHLVNRQENSCTIYMLLEKCEGNASFNEKTTCALLVSSAQNISCSISGHIVLHDKIYSALAHAFIGPVPDYLLLKGDIAGYVHLTPFYGSSIKISESVVLCKLGEPILGLFAFPSGNMCYGLREARDTILIAGKYGHVVAISFGDNYGKNSCFTSSYSASYESIFDIKLDNHDFDIRDWSIDADMSSVCMIGFQHFCYCAGSEVFISLIFEDQSSQNFGTTKYQLPSYKQSSSSSDVDKTKLKCLEHANFILKDILYPKKIAVAEPAILVTGKNCAIRNSVGRPLVILCGRGRILGVDISHTVLAGAIKRKTWRAWESNIEDHVKNLINAVDDISRASDHINKCNESLNLAMCELADSLKLSALLLRNQSINANAGSAISKNKSISNTEPLLSCTVDMSLFHTTISSLKNLVFGELSDTSGLSHIEEIVRNQIGIPARMTITLSNRTPFSLSSHWTLVLEIYRSGMEKIKVSSFNILINNGLGLSSYGQCIIDCDVKLPCLHRGSLDAYIYLCHTHDQHELVYEQCSSSYGSTLKTLKDLQCLESVHETNVDEFLATLSLDEFDATSLVRDFKPNEFGSILIPLSFHKIDILSFVSKPLEKYCHTAKAEKMDSGSFGLSINKLICNNFHESLLGPFSGILRVSGRICENSSRCPVNVSKLWRDLFPDGFTDKGSLSKAGDKITFMVPGGEVFSITLKCTNECEIQLHVNAPTLLLASLLRDALNWRLKCHETTNVQDRATAPVTDSVSAMSQTDANVEEIMNQLEMLSDRARILLSTWDEKRRQNQDETQDILPLIADIYNVINDILKLYRSSWEH